MSRVKKAGGAIAVLAVLVVGGHEGKRNWAYQDIVHVWTACYGETQGIHPRMYFTDAQCDEMFLRRLDEFGAGMERCAPILADEKRISVKAYVAHLDTAYNVGLGAFCKGSIARQLNAGNVRASCDAFLLYDMAGGRHVHALYARREDVRKLCLEGL